jgi:hypothetical protein
LILYELTWFLFSFPANYIHKVKELRINQQGIYYFFYLYVCVPKFYYGFIQEVQVDRMHTINKICHWGAKISPEYSTWHAKLVVRTIERSSHFVGSTAGQGLFSLYIGTEEVLLLALMIVYI